ncbi:MAG TPA: 5-oxoprolinase subunit PxpA [Candidatus Limnocylindria bacterium]|nr:5-oxoprolinase subunit PxpA [Candidatus Limnocylindria bacterium]
MTAVDLNSDLGEGAGEDERIMPLVTSANVACGAHAGDERTMRATVSLALLHGVAVGAHPGYRDAASFGRVPVEMPREALIADVVAQIEDLRRIARELGAEVTHVKAHGALYNQGERDAAIADAIAEAVAHVDASLAVVATPRSAMARAARERGLRVAREGFIDRAYEPDGTLRSRKLPGALITDPAAAAEHAVALVRGGDLDTLCVHGDTPGAPAIVAAARRALADAGVEVRPFR